MTANVVTGMGSAGLLVIVSVLIVWLGRVCERGTLARNHLVGIRTRATLASDAAWVAGHRAGAHRILIGGLGAVGISLVAVAAGCLSLLGVSENITNATIAAFVIGACVWLVAWMIAATAAANRAARTVQQ